MKNQTFFCHRFTSKRIPFDIVDYSKFKHGSIRVAKKYGREMAEGYYKGSFLKTNTKQIVVFSSPYFFIPSAANFIKEAFIHRINTLLVENGSKPVLDGRIYRELSYHSDYAKMEAEERERLISSDNFYVDRKLVLGRLSLHIDDVCITGTHERMLSNLKLPNYACLYYAKYAGHNPTVEHHLNTNFINSLERLNFMMRTDRIYFNVRNIRMMLTAEPELFKEFLNLRSPSFRTELYEWSIGNLYHTVNDFKQNFLILKNKINANYREETPA